MNITNLEKMLDYKSPAISVIAVASEGILCESGNELTESLKENMGTWSLRDLDL